MDMYKYDTHELLCSTVPVLLSYLASGRPNVITPTVRASCTYTKDYIMFLCSLDKRVIRCASLLSLDRE
jgi:hypothetical protein